MTNTKKIALAAVAALPVAAFAGGPDLSPLTQQVDFSTTTAAVLAIAGLLAGVYIALKGAHIVLAMIRGR
jgi:hypothetical protein